MALSIISLFYYISLSIIVFLIMLPFVEICGLRVGRAAFRLVRGGEKVCRDLRQKEIPQKEILQKEIP